MDIYSVANVARATWLMDSDLDQTSLSQLRLEDVEQTGVELGRGSYGVVEELVVNGLK